jgi:hypothetical protein
MSTEWVVTTAAERITLNAQRQGEMTFTVTNPTTAADRAVFDIVPGDGADPTWFQVDEPQRPVRGTSSVAYVVKMAVPPPVKPGDYELQGRVYSADSAPEESSVLSSRVMVTVAPADAPPKRRIPWWVFVVAGLVVIALVGTIVVVATRGGSPGPTPSGTPTPSGPTVAVPDVSKLKVVDAMAALTKADLVSSVKYKQDPAQAGHVDQSIPAGTQVVRGSTVDLTAHVSMQPPQLIGPIPNSRTQVNPLPTLIWQDPDAFVHNWEVRVLIRSCFIGPLLAGPPCTDLVREDVRVTKPNYQPIVRLTPVPPGALGVFDNGVVLWLVIPYDDFNQAGPGTGPFPFNATG